MLPVLLFVGALVWGASQAMGILPALGLALAVMLAVASFLPLKGRKLSQVKLPLWGMVTAHFGIAVALLGMASDAAFTTERLVAARPGDVLEVGPWQVQLQRIEPVAGPNWTALRGDLAVSYKGGPISELHPAARTFWSPPNETNEAALKTRWNGQLYAVLGQQADGGRWQLRLWWKPFVPMIWYGGILIALGGLLALFGRLSSDLRRLVARDKIAYRR
ncbi:MAG: cytochrome c-type biogenesis CcmF C-terminal domain-containing protein, partial [Novosphingobium sp.]